MTAGASRGRPLALAAMGAVVVALFVAELTWGQIAVPLSEVWRVLSGESASRLSWDHVVRDFRLPRAVAALLFGAAMGVTGLLLQTLFRNPLADAWALGVVHASRFGVACLVVGVHAAGSGIYARFGLAGDAAIAVAAALGGSLAMVVLQALSRRTSTVTLLILGLRLGYFFTGAISVVLHFTDEAHFRVFQAWDDASFSLVTPAQLRIAAPIVALGAAGAFAMAKPLNALLLGEQYAHSLGVSVPLIRQLAFLIVTVLTGVATGYCGPIAFLGIIAPHLCRALLRTSDHWTLVPACLLAGGALALGADWAIHLPWRQHLFHLNAINGLIGAPVVFWVLLRRGGRLAAETQ